MMKKMFAGALFCAGLLFSATAEAQFADGKVNQGFSGRKAFDIPERLTFEQGTLECFFQLDVPVSELNPAMLMSCGNNAPGWWYLRISKDSLGLHVKQNDKGGYAVVSTPVDGLRKGEWHHVAAVWGKYKEKGFLRLYLDGKLCAYRQVALPDKPSAGKLGIRYNSAYYAEKSFPGAIDEFVLYDVALSPEQIAARCKDPANSRPGSGMIIHIPFDASYDVVQGAACDPEEARKMLRKASRKSKIAKYPDELPFNYRFEVPMPEEKKPGTLNDGDENTYVAWRQRQISLICELERTFDIAEVEIAAPKYTRWYMLKELHVSFDNGSGEFGTPVIVKCYGIQKHASRKDIDETCKMYYYRIPNPGKACRIRIKPVGDAYMSLNEIRIREKR